MVVDDSVVARRVISEVLDAEPDLEVVGTAPNGRIALAKLPTLAPDVITLDVDMPEMDGLKMLARVRAEYPTVKVIMVSGLTERGARATVESLFLGAADYVTKAAGSATRAEAATYLREQLVAKVRALAPRRASGARTRRPAARVGSTKGEARRAAQPIEIVGIGASTGGPNALAEVMAALPGGFPTPVVIVQHMPESFTTYLATRLDKTSRVKVAESSDGAPLTPGCALVARGNRHLEVERGGDGARVRLTDGPLVNSCRPSVDVLFESLAGAYGGATLAIVLTGMGQDGLRGCGRIHAEGGQIVVQDAATSVVWGMPGQIAQANLADDVLPISEIGAEVVRRVEESRA